MKVAFQSILVLVLLVACQAPPTRVTVVDSELNTRAFKNVHFKNKFDPEKSVIIDTRSRFDFELSKVPRSIHVFWKDWQMAPYKGVELEKRKYELQRRLARHGIDPYTSVIIFGDGLNGDGSELFVAATLFSLGIEKIAVVSPKKLKESMTAKKMPELFGVPYWEKPLRYNFSCTNRKVAKTYNVVRNADKGGKTPRIVVDRSLNKKLQWRAGPQIANRRSTVAFQSNDLWAYGIAFHYLKKGNKVCVQ